MTIGEAAGLALKAHGAVWVAAAAAYYKYGDRTDLFEKAVRGNRSARQSIRDSVASDLGKQLQPVIRNAAGVRSSLLDAAGAYIEQSIDVTESEPFYQAIRDFVSASASALLDYKLILQATERWRIWARRLSHCILALVAWETFMLAAAVLILVLADLTMTANKWLTIASFAPTAVAVLLLFVCLAVVHAKQGVIADVRERYDPEA
jgi:hypothetical protein